MGFLKFQQENSGEDLQLIQNNLGSLRVNLDSEHLENPVVKLERKSSFIELQNKLKIIDENILAHSSKNFLKDISSIAEKEIAVENNIIKEEKSTSINNSKIISHSAESLYNSMSSGGKEILTEWHRR